MSNRKKPRKQRKPQRDTQRLLKIGTVRVGVQRGEDGVVMVSIADGGTALAAVEIGADVKAFLLNPDATSQFAIGRMADGSHKLVAFGDGNKVVDVIDLETEQHELATGSSDFDAEQN